MSGRSGKISQVFAGLPRFQNDDTVAAAAAAAAMKVATLELPRLQTDFAMYEYESISNFQGGRPPLKYSERDVDLPCETRAFK